MKRLFGMAILPLLFTALVRGEVKSSISQYGITWTFNADHTVGRFANGDWWVLGPVTITGITPAFTGTSNGWEVNPRVAGNQGFQSGCYGGGFDANLVPDLPYTSPSSGIVSIVKTTPTGNDRPCIQTAAVLTVVTETPPDNGATVFRPPYVAADKPYYYVSDLKTDLLPKYAPNTLINNFKPSISEVASWFTKLRLDHKGGALGRALRPLDAMDDYQPANTPRINSGALLFMLDPGAADITPALIQYIQAGIDKVYSILDGQTWPAGGGHQPGHIIMSAFTAVMLDIKEARDLLKDADFFHASGNMVQATRQGYRLWGNSSTEAGYWSYVMGSGGNRAQKDPYGYIDGGECGEAYQVITSQSHKGEALAAHLMPELVSAWPTADLAYARDYADRWVNLGTWSQPDPCAPYTAGGTYEADYGPDPNHPGQCIRDQDLEYYNGPDDFKCRAGAECGRYPAKHGTVRDGGQYKSNFVAAVWNAFRGPSAYDGKCDSGETNTYDCGPAGVAELPRVEALVPGFKMELTNNPFQSREQALVINYYGSEDKVTSARIRDAQGRVVKQFDRTTRPLVWDGRDHSGRLAAPGMYYVMLTSGSSVVVAPMAVVR